MKRRFHYYYIGYRTDGGLNVRLLLGHKYKTLEEADEMAKAMQPTYPNKLGVFLY